MKTKILTINEYNSCCNRINKQNSVYKYINWLNDIRVNIDENDRIIQI